MGQEQLSKGLREDGLAQLQSAARVCAGDSQEARLVKADLQRSGTAIPRAIQVSTTPRPAGAAPSPAVPTSPPIPRVKPPTPKPTSATVGDPLGLRGSMK
jgi:hypothetical protein